MKEESQWPTLEGRLKHAPKSQLEALLQLSKTNILSELGQKTLQKLLDEKKKSE